MSLLLGLNRTFGVSCSMLRTRSCLDYLIGHFLICESLEREDQVFPLTIPLVLSLPGTCVYFITVPPFPTFSDTYVGYSVYSQRTPKVTSTDLLLVTSLYCRADSLNQFI